MKGMRGGLTMGSERYNMLDESTLELLYFLLLSCFRFFLLFSFRWIG